jgi:hypothetical protein
MSFMIMDSLRHIDPQTGNPLEAWTLPVSGFLSFRPFS